jgi:subtilisin-like proprotein convertase family protein
MQFSLVLDAAGKRITNRFSQRVGTRQFNALATNSVASTNVPVAIPDLGTGISSLQVSLPDNPIVESLTAAVRIDHTTIGDVRLYLQHPDGSRNPALRQRRRRLPQHGRRRLRHWAFDGVQ